MAVGIENLNKESQPSLSQNSEKRRWFQTIGERVRKIRLAQGLTQRQLGQKMGVDHSSISQIETGTLLNLILLKKIAEAFSVEMEYFFGDYNEKEELLAQKPVKQFIKIFLKLRAVDRKTIMDLARYLESKIEEE